MILFWQWNSFCNRGITEAMRAMGRDFDIFFYQPGDAAAWESDPVFEKEAKQALSKKAYDTVFSVNFHPLLSNLCEEKGVRYVSWVYDAPLHIRDLSPLKNTCNEVYFFDRGECEEYQRLGYPVRYLPLAGDVLFDPGRVREDKDVSLVGHLYQNEFGYYMQPLSDYDRGRIEGFLASQLKVYGAFLIPELLTGELMESLNRSYLKASGEQVRVEKREMEFLLAREVTARERFLAITLLSSIAEVHVFGPEKADQLETVHFHPYTDYYSGMPRVFASSKINLNITLRCIRTGLPLRIFDILSCRGFCLTNFQPELPEYFNLGEDLVVYRDLEEMKYLAEYYLKHEDARRLIAENGFRRIERDHGFRARLEEIL